MRKLAIPFLAVAGLAVSAAGASAQSVSVEIGPTYGYSNYGGNYGPRYSEGYYGYRSVAPARRDYGRSYGYRSDETVTERGTAGGCGTYFYWEDGRCVDARNK